MQSGLCKSFIRLSSRSQSNFNKGEKRKKNGGGGGGGGAREMKKEEDTTEENDAVEVNGKIDSNTWRRDRKSWVETGKRGKGVRQREGGRERE